MTENIGTVADQFKPAIVKYVKGSFFIVEGKNEANKFFILQEGKVLITREVDMVIGSKGHIAKPGDIIAAASAISGYSYIENAEAVTDATLMAVEAKQYGSLIRSNTPIAMRIIQQFSERLRTMNEMLSRLTLNDAAEIDPSHLLRVAEYYADQRKSGQALYAYKQYFTLCPDAPVSDDVKRKVAQLATSASILKPHNSPKKKNERVYPVGAIIFAEGEQGNELYIIEKGSVKISKIANNQEVVLAILHQGDIFGEMALLEEDKFRSATAEANEECTVLAVDRANFEELTRASPEMVARLTAVLAERLWLKYRRLSNLMIDDPLGRLYDALLIQLIKEKVPLDTNQPYRLDFGFRELAEMARIPQNDHKEMQRKLLLNKRIVINDNGIFISDSSDIFRQAEYYRRSKIHARKKSDS
jgi:CRP-like cAMP-binding protein